MRKELSYRLPDYKLYPNPILLTFWPFGVNSAFTNSGYHFHYTL